MTNLKNYITVTVAYWAFMLTDGALRMLVLLYFHEEGYSPVQLAFLFLLYEFFGIVTNLLGGWLANRCGLKATLIAGLALQILAMNMLSFLNTDWPTAIAVTFIMTAQALSGIAKDLTKMSSKTAIKFLIPENKSSQLFKWVAILTGSKNAIKGAGFFVGAFLLQTIGFQQSLWLMSAGITLILCTSLASLPTDIGKAKSKNKLSSIFNQGRNINLLSSARLFLFGARDIWFVVALPVFLNSVMGWQHSRTGIFMASWIILYGLIQGVAPKILKKRSNGRTPDGLIATELAAILCASMLLIILAYTCQWHIQTSIIIGLFLFGALFAINSSVHSFLILEYADGDKAAINVGFYYMANAGGRLIGTLLSGLLYQWQGINACLIGSAIFLATTVIISLKLPRHDH